MYGLIFNEAAGARFQHQTVPCQFAEITAEADEAIVAQLVKHDAVQKRGSNSSRELRGYRLGNVDTDKTCFAMIDEDMQVHSAIYVKRDTKDVSEGYRALNGNVRGILCSHVEALTAEPQSIIFYSISNISGQAGMGKVLVRNLHAHLNERYDENVVFSTLSPLRTFDRFLRQQGIRSIFFATFNPAWQRRLVLSHLATVENDVQKFHMGNGAVIGDVKLRADSQGLSRVMVNYVYGRDPHILTSRAQAFKAGNLPALVDPALLAETGYKFPTGRRLEPAVP